MSCKDNPAGHEATPNNKTRSNLGTGLGTKLDNAYDSLVSPTGKMTPRTNANRRKLAAEARLGSAAKNDGEGALQELTMNPNGLDEESGYQKRRRKHKPTTVADPPRLERHVDRSARKKTAHMIIERSSLGCASDNEEESLFENVYSEVEDEEAAQEEVDSEEDISKIAPDTPSKRGKISASKRQKRSPTPPLDLSPHELYFSQNRPGRTKTSNTNLSSVALLDHEEYFELVRSYKSQHNDDLEYLQAEYAKSFNQWQFELSQGFNICLYGFGSKRSLLMKFAEYIDDRQKDDINKKVVIVNGYVSSMSLIKDTLQTIAAAVSDPAAGPPKLGSQPAGMLDSLVQLLDEDPSKHVTLVLHSIDGPTLRRPTVQAILSRISSFSQVKLIASANHPSFPLLWDSSIRSTFNFVFHDSTTFQPYTSEIDVVDEVNELLGRSSRRVGGKGGVGFVLKSLPEKARKLYEILIQEQLASMGGQSALDRRDDEDDNDSRSMNMAKSEAGIEFRLLYQKAVEEFICSTEMNFRTQLKEFYDHKMIESHFDFLGTEVISIPFKKDELETILEDLTS